MGVLELRVLGYVREKTTSLNFDPERVDVVGSSVWGEEDFLGFLGRVSVLTERTLGLSPSYNGYRNFGAPVLVFRTPVDTRGRVDVPEPVRGTGGPRRQGRKAHPYCH